MFTNDLLSSYHVAHPGLLMKFTLLIVVLIGLYLCTTSLESTVVDGLDEKAIKYVDQIFHSLTLRKLVYESIGDSSRDHNDYTIKKNQDGTINLSYVVSTGERKLVVRIKDLTILDLSDMNRTNREVDILKKLQREGREFKVVHQFLNGKLLPCVLRMRL
jgi:hypothetical protein